MSSNDKIPFSKIAPSSDAEWAEALKCYARDREYQKEESSSNVSKHKIKDIHRSANTHWSASQSPPTQDVTFQPLKSDETNSKPPLVHHGHSDDSMDAGIGGIPYKKPENIPGPFKCIEAATEDVPSIHQYDNQPSNTHWHNRQYSTNGEQSINFSKNMAAIEPIPLAFDTARTIPQERLESDFNSDDFRSADKERKRMQQFYEKNGWLPGPVPNKLNRLKRRRAIRRLGLIGEEEDGRKSVLSKYAEMAELVFDVPRALVSVIHDEVEFAYSADINKKPISRPTQQAACSHVIDIHDGDCWIIADCTNDWRTRDHPLFQDKLYKFFAAAPLRYHGKDGSIIDFGSLNIYDTEPRYTFSQRERSLLLKLSNMLVYQLATLQSEYMAKRSTAMYEASISFLRRSFVSNPSETQSRRGSRRVSSSHASPSPPQRLPSPRKKMQPPNVSTSTAVASKLGPWDDKDARRLAIQSDRTLFNDAAETLKGLLNADAVVVLNMEDYQLFIKKSSSVSSHALEGKKGKDRIRSKEKIIIDYMNGDPWPEDIEPVINYIGKQSSQAEILGSAFSKGDIELSDQFNFDVPDVEDTLGEFLKTYLSKRQFWWDREENTDSLSGKIMQLMPQQAQTALGTTFLGHDGKIKFVMFATWNTPPSSLVDSSMIALPFVWILGGCLMAALAMKKIRALEQSQISYSNLQAHELRTPLHQILAITQLLRSTMSDLAETNSSSTPSKLTSTEQIRDMMPFLDAIDTGGKTLHGIVDNILSFLDLKGRESSRSFGDAALLAAPSGTQTSLETMLEEILENVMLEDQKSRKANGQPDVEVETIFEIIPPLLGEQVSEDAGGALRRALTKILANAYKFINNEGCVEIYVDDVVDLLPPEGCEDIALTRLISIIIKDDGRGMDPAFVNDKLGQPWAKEDSYITGSGLSVHLAYRIIDLMGGCMEITSAQGAGTTVQIDVPLPLRSIPFTDLHNSEPGSRRESTDSIRQLTVNQDSINVGRKVYLLGWEGSRINVVGKALNRQYTKLGCEIVNDISQAQLIIAFGKVEEDLELFKRKIYSQNLKTDNLVYLTSENHKANSEVLKLQDEKQYKVRRFKRPTNPSILRETLFPNHSKRLQDTVKEENNNHDNNDFKRSDSHVPSPTNEQADLEMDSGTINTPHLMSPNGDDMGEPFDSKGIKGLYHHNGSRESNQSTANRENSLAQISEASRDKLDKDATSTKSIEDVIADLSLGIYSPVDVNPQQLTADRDVDANEGVTKEQSTHNLQINNLQQGRSQVKTGDSSNSNLLPNNNTSVASGKDTQTDTVGQPSNPSICPTKSVNKNNHISLASNPNKVKVLVVEDNKINRTILVKILSSTLSSIIEVYEAEDGNYAIEIFKKLISNNNNNQPIIVLLDINMPKKDGFQTCLEMRLIEKELKIKSQIIAVTALGSEEEKRKGLVECDMNKWFIKPCSKSTIIEIVKQAYNEISLKN
ncbi:uncharacterized protein I206_104794 [Kwoniella pini CBS 10737]|uniref:histidine kinase n=1 Tax=Kwoniella pini CBS 10737 TaxID=1296096 RepID=A0A1B9I7T9_9TREE|nr:uncharacterized protein I206_02333 [Kwoniella pini CBS 10737]OCF51618.1 hypothetical protein I206_02333 [Kwoniella pini CBS 10737]